MKATTFGSSCVEGKDHDAKGNPIKQRFRAYDSMDEYAADKIQFLKRLYDFDENDDINRFTAKLTGENKGKRKYAEAINYATSLANVYNKFAEGGIIKAQNGSKSEELLVKKALEFGQKTSEKMSPYDVRLIDFIKSKEGFRPKPEKDKTDGKWTVGYGLTDPKLIRKYRNGITEEEASKHLIQHLQMGADSLATMPYYDNLNLGEKTALNDLIYNVGWNKFKNSKRLQSHLRTGNDAGAKKEMNHGEHQARGLKIRRNQNRQMYDSTFSWKYKKGGVAKYQEPAQGIQRRDATYVSPTYHNSPYKNVNYKPTSEIETVFPKWTIRDNKLVKTTPRTKSRVIPLEPVSPEFDILTGLRGITSLFGNKPKPMILKSNTSKLTKTERMGIPKGERNSSSPYNEIGTAKAGDSDFRKITVNSPIFGDYIDNGSQQAVFHNANDPNKVLKVLVDRKFTSIPEIKEFHKQWMKRNQVPMQEKIKFEGYLQGGDRIYPVYSQNKVDVLGDIIPYEWAEVHLPRINKEMHKLGYTGEGTFTNGKITVGEINPRNVGYKDGNIRFIDADVYRKGGKLLFRDRT